MVRVTFRHCDIPAAALHSFCVWSWPRTQRSVSFLNVRVTLNVRSTPPVETSSARTLPNVSKSVTVDTESRSSVALPPPASASRTYASMAVVAPFGVR
ncbi:hypothetical protein BE18_38595 [Sorangium cellulosum]|uniref:Uncharacterized protein n=1 Tax=Sorangium cellulosum TaxID=56 RepID=A0A150SA57_SORCE|nr:hypothetical protein BE18_38595 [Sorangium cellulosum]